MSLSVGVVITSFNQGDMLWEAVQSVLGQSRAAEELIVVDDGSGAEASEVLDALDRRGVRVLRQPNLGVSAARNSGFAELGTDCVAVLDGDDRYGQRFLEATMAVLQEDPDVVAASSWLRMFGVTDAIVRPAGGALVDFLARNACPAAAVVRRGAWEEAGGYQESMRGGFEDWDFFLSVLEPGGRIDVVGQPLIDYRTSLQSANIASMEHRLELYGQLIDRHLGAFTANLRSVVLAHESASSERAARWERLLLADDALEVGEVSYGDGGMAAAVRIAAARGSMEHRSEESRY